MTCYGDLLGSGGFQDVVMANLLGSGCLQVTVRSRIRKLRSRGKVVAGRPLAGSRPPMQILKDA